jgi:hypothetical protein
MGAGGVRKAAGYKSDAAAPVDLEAIRKAAQQAAEAQKVRWRPLGWAPGL